MKFESIGTRLGPISREVACRRLGAAHDVALAELESLIKQQGATTAIANLTRELGEILIADGRLSDARSYVFEARRRYRPLRQEKKLASEVDLLLANYAFRDNRSGEGQAILDDARQRCENLPEARLVWGRALRLEAHLSVVRGDLHRAEHFIDRAIEATERDFFFTATAADEAERLLHRSQYMFTKGEIAFLNGQPDAARAWTEDALSFINRVFVHEPDYRAFAKQRARHALNLFDGVAANDSDPGAQSPFLRGAEHG
jgi:tetratricopeptide (TPR) repeat protein